MEKLNDIKYIVTHPGKAHRDEFLAMGLAVHCMRRTTVPKVYRRDPTTEELDDPQILVLDCGGRHEPELNNFDHHQLEKTKDREPECALSLLAKRLGVHEQLSVLPWYRWTIDLDDRGPRYAASRLGYAEELPEAIVSPVEGFILREFSEYKIVEPDVVHLASVIMWNALEEAEATHKAVQEIEKHSEIRRLLLPENYSLYTLLCNAEPEYTRYIKSHREVAYNRYGGYDYDLTISRVVDGRGERIAVYRYSDIEEIVDLTKLSGDYGKRAKGLQWVHKNGFLANFDPAMTIEEVYEEVKAVFQKRPNE